MIEVKVLIVPECSDGDIKHWIQFFSKIENVEKAPHQAMQNDILYYLNALKYFKDKSEEMQKTLEWYADGTNYDRHENDRKDGLHNPSAYDIDFGERARQVLNGVETK